MTGAEKEAAIEEENKRHRDTVAQIEGMYDAKIALNENTAESLKDQYGIGSLSSASYYQRRESEISTEISNKTSKMYYTSSALERAQLQEEINDLQDERKEVLICLKIVEIEEETEDLIRERDTLLAYEDAAHEKNLKAIEEQYG